MRFHVQNMVTVCREVVRVKVRKEAKLLLNKKAALKTLVQIFYN